MNTAPTRRSYFAVPLERGVEIRGYIDGDFEIVDGDVTIPLSSAGANRLFMILASRLGKAPLKAV